MHLPKPFLFLFAAFAAAWLPARLAAQPLIIVEPVNHSAFQGDASANFTIAATGTGLSYQWQVLPAGSSTWSNITSGTGSYTNSATPNLTVVSPTPTLNDFKYRCVVTDSNNDTTTSMGAMLKAFAAPSGPGSAPTLTVSPSTLAANSTATVTITISGLTPGSSVRVRRYLDANGNGNIDTGEQLVQSFPVTDGQQTSFDGIVDPDIPGDTDGSANGVIVTHFDLPTSPEAGRTSGNYIIHVSSPTGAFAPVIFKHFIVTQPAYGQSISGQVTSNGSPVANAGVIVLASNGHNETYIASNISNNNGNYTITAPPGNYSVVPFQVGHVASFANSPSVTVVFHQNLTDKNPTLTPATATITGQVTDSVDANNTLQAVQLFAVSDSMGEVTLASSDSDGAYDVSATAASDWDFNVSQYSTNTLGYLPPINDPIFDTTSGNTSLFQNIPIPLTAANALIYGSFTNTVPAPLSNVSIEANDNFGYDTQSSTDLSGNYFLLAFGNTSGNPDTWNVNPSTDDNPALDGYIVTPNYQNVNLMAGQAAQANFVAENATNFFNGTVTNHGTPVPGVQIDAGAEINGTFINLQATTDSNGDFSIGTNVGNWTLSLDNQSASDFNLVGASFSENVTSPGQNINGIILPVTNATFVISGTVTDAFGDPVTFTNVGAFATIGGNTFSAGANTDANGDYSFPVINGSWDVNVSNGNYTDQTVDINGANQTVNFAFSPDSVIVSQPQNQVANTGQSTNFNIGVNVPGSATFQWQIFADGGSTWSNLTDTSPYNGSATLNLSISDSTGLNGNQYRCLVIFTLAGTPVTATSNAATLTVQPVGAPSFIQNPNNQTVTAGSDTGFAANATGTPAPSFQWQSSADGGNTWSNLTDNITFAGVDTTNLVIMFVPLAMNGTQFRSFAFNTNGNATSSPATLTVNSNQTAPGFSVNPTNQSVSAGSDTGFSAVVTGTPAPNLQWQISTNNGSNWSNLTDNVTIAGVTTTSLVIMDANLTLNGAQFRLFAFNSAGNATSGPATLTVTSNTTAPGIVFNPTNQTVSAGSDTGFSSNATGTPAPSLQWQILRAGNSTWSNLTDNVTIAGVTTTSLVIMDALASMNGDQFRLFAFNSVGNATSGPATLTVNSTAPAILDQPANTTVAVGGNTSFTVVATGTLPLAYQWKFNGKNISGATNATYNIAKVAASNAGTYTVFVSNSGGSVTSQPATLTLGTLPKITTSPSSLTINLGLNATFSVVATGTATIAYQWQGMLPGSSTWSNLFDEDGVIAGNNTATLTFITPNTTISGGQVRVIVSNPYGTVISKGATLTVKAVPTANVTTNPPATNGTIVVSAGNSVLFSAGNITGTPPLKIQWTLNGKNISGATSANYTIASASSTSTGNYAVVITNANGKFTGGPFFLNVLTLPSIITQPKAQSIKAGQTATFVVKAAGNPPPTYQWKLNGSNLSDGPITGGIVIGSTNSTLKLTNVTTALNSSSYKVLLMNTQGNLTSAQVTLTVK
jgi:uncharacterized GH25 family protein